MAVLYMLWDFKCFMLVMSKVYSSSFSLLVINPVSISKFAHDTVYYLRKHDSSSEKYL